MDEAAGGRGGLPPAMVDEEEARQRRLERMRGRKSGPRPNPRIEERRKSVEELAAGGGSARRASGSGLVAAPAPSAGSDAVGALFAAMDLNRDGGISRGEMQQAFSAAAAPPSTDALADRLGARMASPPLEPAAAAAPPASPAPAPAPAPALAALTTSAASATSVPPPSAATTPARAAGLHQPKSMLLGHPAAASLHKPGSLLPRPADSVRGLLDAPPSPLVTTSSMVSELAQLRQLRRDGDITDQEMASARQQLLQRPAPQASPVAERSYSAARTPPVTGSVTGLTPRRAPTTPTPYTASVSDKLLSQLRNESALAQHQTNALLLKLNGDMRSFSSSRERTRVAAASQAAADRVATKAAFDHEIAGLDLGAPPLAESPKPTSFATSRAAVAEEPASDDAAIQLLRKLEGDIVELGSVRSSHRRSLDDSSRSVIPVPPGRTPDGERKPSSFQEALAVPSPRSSATAAMLALFGKNAAAPPSPKADTSQTMAAEVSVTEPTSLRPESATALPDLSPAAPAPEPETSAPPALGGVLDLLSKLDADLDRSRNSPRAPESSDMRFAWEKEGEELSLDGLDKSLDSLQEAEAARPAGGRSSLLDGLDGLRDQSYVMESIRTISTGSAGGWFEGADGGEELPEAEPQLQLKPQPQPQPEPEPAAALDFSSSSTAKLPATTAPAGVAASVPDDGAAKAEEARAEKARAEAAAAAAAAQAKADADTAQAAAEREAAALKAKQEAEARAAEEAAAQAAAEQASKQAAEEEEKAKLAAAQRKEEEERAAAAAKQQQQEEERAAAAAAAEAKRKEEEEAAEAKAKADAEAAAAAAAPAPAPQPEPEPEPAPAPAPTPAPAPAPEPAPAPAPAPEPAPPPASKGPPPRKAGPPPMKSKGPPAMKSKGPPAMKGKGPPAMKGKGPPAMKGKGPPAKKAGPPAMKKVRPLSVTNKSRWLTGAVCLLVQKGPPAMKKKGPPPME